MANYLQRQDFSFKVLAAQGSSDADCETTLFDVTATNRENGKL